MAAHDKAQEPEASGLLALEAHRLDDEANRLRSRLAARRVSLYFVRLPVYAAAGLGLGLLVLKSPAQQELSMFAAASALIGLVAEPSLALYRLAKLRRICREQAVLAKKLGVRD